MHFNYLKKEDEVIAKWEMIANKSLKKNKKEDEMIVSNQIKTFIKRYVQQKKYLNEFKNNKDYENYEQEFNEYKRLIADKMFKLQVENMELKEENTRLISLINKKKWYHDLF